MLTVLHFLLARPRQSQKQGEAQTSHVSCLLVKPTLSIPVRTSAKRPSKNFYRRIIYLQNCDKHWRIIHMDSLAFHAVMRVSLMMSVVRNISFLYLTFRMFNRWSHLKDLILNAPFYRCNLHHYCHLFLPVRLFSGLGSLLIKSCIFFVIF